MKLTKLLTGILAGAAVSAFASAATATPKKVGPVSYYGALHTSGSKIIGEKNNQQAMLRGVSLFWSDATGASYYNPTVISWAADNFKIDVFRYAMGVEYYDSNGGTKNKLDDQSSYAKSPEGQLSTIDKMVEAAIENDIYIVIDWHSHRAHLETSMAKTFFETISKKYKDVPNIIYEIYNEPVNGSGGDWGAIKNYANQIVSTIRLNTQNLIIVGTPNWSQHPEQGARDPIQSTNIAYVLHFYAATHPKGSFSGNITSALNAGYPVFISEWGTTNADGDGEPNSSATNEWTQFMDQNNIPNCNWSFRQQTSDVDQKSEKSAIFAGDKSLTTAAALDAATLTTSGNIIKSYLTKNARSWADSITKGKSGSCSFKATTAKQTDGKISGALKSGCTYTSSNEKVVSVSGSDLVINDYGFAILTGNDGSQSVVTVKQVAGQTITNLEKGLYCTYANTCKSDVKTGRSIDFDGDGSNDYLLTMEDKTNEGSKFTLTALDPTVVSVSKSKCTNNNCSNTQKNQQVWMLHFKSYGKGRIVASAPAITGFRAMQDTFEIEYRKGEARISNKFVNQKVAPGSTSPTGLPTTTLTDKAPVTYTFNGQPTTIYMVQAGEGFGAGTAPAIISVTAKAPETANYNELNKTVLFIIGDSTQAVNKDEYYNFINGTSAIRPSAKITNSLKARMNGSTLQFTTKNTGLVKVDIYDALGASVKQISDVYGKGSHAIDLKGIANGSYTLVVRQGSSKASIRWVNK
ncbi:cellulase family glycosylhydrolase [Fibrobacter sp. UBA4297]|uniref:cellulase family glycosylhydrolase n=1 Tax=Fibrobacter sp. UBA4297 TaxID=1946536 RepID=UPI0025BBB78C|nr:cellulase family glycosylhydrolase [Fibrobacter sp. UBA4297]